MSLEGERIEFADGGTQAPFGIEPRLTQISQAVMPVGMVADEVLPPVPVDGPLFAYATDITDEAFTVPDVRIGRTGRANQVEHGAVNATDEILDYGLEEPVPRRDQATARAQMVRRDPLARATENVARRVKLAREKRVADLVTSTDSYDASLHETVTGNDRWDKAASDPKGAILDARDKLLMPANTMVLSQPVWTELSQHPSIVESVYHSGAGKTDAAGRATKMAVAELLEVDRIVVGAVKYNASRRGQTPSYQFMWGKHAALLYIDPNVAATDEGKSTFGFTAMWGDLEGVTVYFDESRGVIGSDVVKVIAPCREVISFRMLGHLWRTVIS